MLRILHADVETPLSAYWKVAHDEPYSFLLESITGGESLARYSFIGVRPASVFELSGADPCPQINQLLQQMDLDSEPNLPKFAGGLVGYLSYDFVQTLENIACKNPDPLGLPEFLLMQTSVLIVFDHARSQILLIAPKTFEAELDRIEDRLSQPLPSLPSGKFMKSEHLSLTPKDQFLQDVRRCKDYIFAGDVFQVVLSQRFSRPTQAHPVNVYRALRTLNPSPYMFLMRFDGFDLIGASPEILVGQEDGEGRLRPIAGTRKRGETEAEDHRLAKELLEDEKECAEHVMLVDLARNDLGKVCETGTVRVNDFMTVEKYSHVMHIVSDVRGKVAPGDPLRLVRATFPAGTLSGAPKVRAMQIIEELEPLRRSWYGGAVGYLAPNGNLDLAITIRSVLMKDGFAYVQAGAGIVFDSDPEREWQECHDKAQAALSAIDMAETQF